MRKVHYEVVLDVFICEEEDVDVVARLSQSVFGILPEGDCLDEVADVQDVTVKSVECTDSR